MFEIESIILFTGILSFLLIAGLHLMRELDIFLKKDKKKRERKKDIEEKGNETNDSNI